MSLRTSTQRPAWMKRAISLLLTAVMVVGLLPAAAPRASAHWADAYLDQLVDWGVLRADQTANPDAPLTRAEFMAVINRAYGYTETGAIPFTDVVPTDWFYDDVSIAYTAGYMAGTSETTASPNDTLTREQAVCILGRNMMLEETPGESLAFSDSRDVSSWARGTLKTAVDNYIVSGYPDNSFHPLAAISKAQMAVLVTQCVGTPVSQSGTYSLGGVFGNVTITAPNVTLRDATISGDLYISGGVGLGGIKLENVNVLGRIIVSGTGESEAGDASVVMRNVNAKAMLVDNMRNKTVTIRADGITEIADTIVRTTAYLEDNNTDDKGLLNISLEGEPGTRLTLAGRIKEVVNKSPDSTVQVAKGSVKKLTVDESATNSTVQIDRNAKVEELNLDVATNVIGEGDIGKLNINAPGSVVTMLPDEIYIRPGLDASIGGIIMDHTAAEEGSTDPRLLSGYPAAKDIAPTSFRADFSGNKKGTIFWAVSSISDGSIGEEALISPPTYGSKAIQGGSVAAPTGGTVVNAQVTGLTVAGSYYLSALLRDEQGRTSPVKVISFSTPDNTVPAFAQGYPYMSRITRDVAQVTVMPTKSCKMYYAVLPQGAQAPTINELKSAAVVGNLGYGVRDLTKNTEDVFTVNNQRLEELKNYVLYLWLTDVDGANSSAVQALPFQVPDETPPIVTPDPYPTADGTTDTTITLKTGMNEAGTVFWVIVPENEPYPLPNNQSVPLSKDNIVDPETGYAISARLDSEYGKLQVANGRGGLQRGQVAVPNADTEVTINIRGLTGETAYDLYYVGRDTAGNYSVEVKKVTVNTADSNGPVVYQYFSDYQGEDETERPLANSDIILRFNETITVNGNNLLELYETIHSKDENVGAGDKGQATTNLMNALRDNFILFQFNNTNGRPFPVVEKDEEGYNPESWVDYEEVVIRRTEDLKGIEVVFPNGEDKAVKMISGGRYYFQLTNIRDNAESPNKTDPPVLRYDNIENAPVKRGHVLNAFETVFAQVILAENKSTSPAPKYQGAENGAGEELGADGKGTGSARVDASFFVSPESTQNANETDCFDIILFGEKSVGYDLYYRILDTKKNNAVVLSDNELFGKYKLPVGINSEPMEAGSNGWVYLGNKQANKAAGEGTWDTGSLNQNVLHLTTGQFPKLRSLGEDLSYEFAISVTTLAGNDQFKTWGEKFDFYAYIVAGGSTKLHNATAAPKYTPEQLLAADGVTSIGQPDTVKLTVTFVESEQPTFEGRSPAFGEGDTFKEITFGLSDPGTLYYVIAPKGSPLPTKVDVKKKVTGVNEDKLDTNIAGHSEKLWTLVTEQTKSAAPGKLVDKETGALEHYVVTNNSPNRSDIIDIAEDDRAFSSLVGGKIIYSGRNGIEITDSIPSADHNKTLEAGKEYYIYIVLEAKSGNILSRSNVYIYNFETSETARPKIHLSTDPGGGKVAVSTTNVPPISSRISYALFTTSDLALNSMFTNDFADHVKTDLKNEYSTFLADFLKNKPTGTTECRVIDAMMETYKNGESVFDYFATEGTGGAKEAVARLIRSQSAGAPLRGVVEPTATGTTATRIVDRTSEMSNKGEFYYLLAVGTHIAGTSEGFKAINNVVVPDLEPPQIMEESKTGTNGIITSGSAKVIDGVATATGTVMITFDKPLYWIASDAPADSRLPVYNASSATGTGDGKAIMEVIGTTKTATLSGGETNPSDAARTFTFNFKDWQYNDSIQFFAGNGRLANAGGQSATTPVTVSLRFKTVQQGLLGEISVPYFEASWRDSKGELHHAEG